MDTKTRTRRRELDANMLYWPEHIESIYKTEPPLQPVENGEGFWGVLLHNRNTKRLQCHECGLWFKSLESHISGGHKMKVRDYKIKYGLPLKHPLINADISRARSNISKKLFRENQNISSAFKKNAKMAQKGLVPRPSSDVSKKGGAYGCNSAAYLNQKGICDEQVKRRYLIVSELAGKQAPGQKDINIYDAKLINAIRGRYGGLTKFREFFGFEKGTYNPPNGHWTEVKIIAAIRKIFIDQKRLPMIRDFYGASKDKPSGKTIIKVMGSFSRARAIALGLTETEATT